MLCEGLLLCLRVGDGTRRYSLAVWLEGAHMSVWPESKKKRGLERLGVSTQTLYCSCHLDLALMWY